MEQEVEPISTECTLENKASFFGQTDQLSVGQNIPPRQVEVSSTSSYGQHQSSCEKNDEHFKRGYIGDRDLIEYVEIWNQEKPSKSKRVKKLDPNLRNRLRILAENYNLEEFRCAVIYAREQDKDFYRNEFNLSRFVNPDQSHVGECFNGHDEDFNYDKAYRDRVLGKSPSKDVGRKFDRDPSEKQIIDCSTSVTEPFSEWRNSDKPNDYKDFFIEYLRSEHLPYTSYYKGKKITCSNACSWILSREQDEIKRNQVLSHFEDAKLWDEARQRVKLSQSQSQELSAIPDEPIRKAKKFTAK